MERNSIAEGSGDEEEVSRDSVELMNEDDEGSHRENNGEEEGDEDYEQTGDWYDEGNDDEDDEEENEIRKQTDKNILTVLKKLEDISEECGDIISYKKNTKSLFEQLVLKLEENNDQIYSLHHRVKYLEQECESKDLQIDKMTIAMQEELDNCHHETEEELERMTRKVNEEITQRQDVEKIVLRLQIENSQLKETLRVQTLPGLDKNLDQLVAQIRDEEAQSYQENFVQLRAVIDSKDMKYQALAEQREAEMRAMISIIKIAQQKIDTFQHQMKVHAQTLAMYREREEKAKRSPVIFMHPPPPPGGREVFVSDADTLSNPSASPKNSTDDQDQKKKSYHDNGKAVVPYRKKNRGKKKITQKDTPSSVSADEPQPPPPTEGTVEVSGNGNQVQQKRKKKAPKSAQKPDGDESAGSSFMSAASLSPNSSSHSLTQSPKTQAAELREKTTVFWSNIRLSL